MSKEPAKRVERIPDPERRRVLELLKAAAVTPVVTVLFSGSRDAWAAS